MPYTRALWRRFTKRKLGASKRTGLLTCTVSLCERTTPAARVMSSMLAIFSISSISGAGDYRAASCRGVTDDLVMAVPSVACDSELGPRPIEPRAYRASSTRRGDRLDIL